MAEPGDRWVGAEARTAFLGIDLGTSEAKAALVAPDGRLLGLGRGGYAMDLGHDGRAEQAPSDWWAAVAAAVREATAATGAGIAIGALCGVGQGPTLVAVDRDGEAVRPAITWQDRRAAPGSSAGGGGGFGLVPKVAWLARAEPASIARAGWLLTSWDALGLWLSGEAATTVQAHEAAPDGAAFRDAGARAEQVPPPQPFGTRLGSLRPAAAAALGLPEGVPVVAGVNDGTASMLGAGLRAPGDAVDTGGTSGGIGIYADRPVAVDGLFLAPAPLPGRWVVGGAMAALGASVDWLQAAVLREALAMDDLIREAAAVPPGAGGLVFLPYLAGERAPLFDEAARGAFVGLTLAHGRAHLARAVLEGAAFALRSVAEPLAAAGAPVRELRPAGRRVPGDAWARIKADVLGAPVAMPAIGDTAVAGAAILAAAGVGAVASLEAGVAAMTSVVARLEPDPGARARYDELFAVYRDLYPVLAPAMHALGGNAAGQV